MYYYLYHRSTIPSQRDNPNLNTSSENPEEKLEADGVCHTSNQSIHLFISLLLECWLKLLPQIKIPVFIILRLSAFCQTRELGQVFVPTKTTYK